MTLRFGEQTYRDGASERLDESRRLLRSEYFGGSVYLAGRAVEGMLRSLIWRRNPRKRSSKLSLDTGHDLRQLLEEVRNLGLLGGGRRDEMLRNNIQHVARLWANNLRFAGSKQLERHWRELGEVSGKRTLKRAAEDYFNTCALVVRRCETLWQR